MDVKMTGLKSFIVSAIVALALVPLAATDPEDPCEGFDACTTGYAYDYEEVLYGSTEGESPVVSFPNPPSVVVVQPDGEQTGFLFDREAPDDE